MLSYKPCIAAKHYRTPFPTINRAGDAKAPMHLLHTDLCGPLPEPSVGGCMDVAKFSDDYSKLLVVRPLTCNSDVPALGQEVLTCKETQSGHRCRVVWTDNGGEYVKSELNEDYSARGIVHQTTVAYNPEQNGAAERANRTLSKRVRARRL